MATPADLLVAWIGRRASPEAMAWLAGKRADLAREKSALALAAAFAPVPRRMGKDDLLLDEDDLKSAEAARPGWRPATLSVDQAARVVLLLDAANGATTSFADRLQTLVGTADLGELIAIYKGLPLFPDPQSLVPLATDGLRTAMRAVFEAVAHDNPFPAENFPQGAWNHMVLKTLFIDSVLHPIAGLDSRWNEELATILVDYAHERWAAHRPVTPELWRGVGRFADAAALSDLRRVLAEGSDMERRAAALALADSRHPGAAAALDAAPDVAAAIASGRLTWNDIRDDPA